MRIPEINTDTLFKQLDHVEVQPTDQVWKNIESRLDNKKKRIIPVFLRYGMAASLLLLVGLFYLIFNDDRPENFHQVAEQIIFQKKERTQESVELTENQYGNLKSKHDVKVASNELPSGLEMDENEDLEIKTASIAERNELSDNSRNNFVASLNSPQEEELFTGELRKMTSLPAEKVAEFTVNSDLALHQDISKSEESFDFFIPSSAEEPVRESGIILSGEYSPTYAFRDLSGVSTRGVDENALMTSGVGFNLAFKMNSRWQVETGVKYAMLGQEVVPQSSPRSVYGAADFSAESSVTLQEVKLDNSLGAIKRSATPAMQSDVREFQSVPNAVVEMKSELSYEESSTLLEQRLNYLQVPFTLRYQVLQQGPVKLSLAGGFGANWLVDNKAWLETSGQRQNIGQTSGVPDLSFSTHAGVTVLVPVFKGFGVRMEPRFNYFLSDISEDSPGKFRPYSFGVFTGLFYEFGK